MIAEWVSLGNQVTSAVLHLVLRVVIDGAGKDVVVTASFYRWGN